MHNETIIEILQNEIACIRKATEKGCGCHGCELVRSDEEIIEALNAAIEALQNEVDIAESMALLDLHD